MRLHTTGRFALAGIVLPGVTWLLLTAAQSSGSRGLEDAIFWVFAVSYPFWVLLWGVMANPTSNLLFLGLLGGSLVLNAVLYGMIGALCARVVRRRGSAAT
jgi:hypothetical protein